MRNDYFPWGIAEGSAFFDRVEESKRLLDNIQEGKHTLLISPRRYGKTSLAKYAIKMANLPYAEMDLFLAIDEQSIESRILKGIRALIQVVSDTPEQWFNTLRNFFNKINKKWTIGVKGLSLELTPDQHQDIAENILDGFNALEHILSKKKLKAVLFIDEFQEITKLQVGNAIEGAIRHFAQSAKSLLFIFSGSNRHILSHMFSDRSRPLYRLCDRINLERIAHDYYKTYLNKVARETWSQPIAEEVFTKIMELTAGHPHYVYVLCSYIWRNCRRQSPTITNVAMCWEKYINEMLKETRAELSQLSVGQLKLLVTIALGANKELTGKEIQHKLNLTSAAIVYALNALEKMDYIERYGDNCFRIINPVIHTTTVMFYSEGTL